MKKNEGGISLFTKKLLKESSKARGKLFILLLGGILVTHPVLAQNKNVTLKMTKVNLEQVIWEIQKQTVYVFMYGAQDVKTVVNLNVDVKNRPALQVLDSCLKATNLTYTVNGNNVVIKKKEVAKQEPPKKVTIMGTVKDEHGEVLPGVAVVVKGTGTGAATDIDGNFKFEADRVSGMILQFSFVGMETQEIPYTGQKSLSIVMKDKSLQVDEVVVTGYQKIDRRLFTGSADIVKAADLAVAGSNDVGRMLQGKSSGVQIQNVSGSFGAAPKMRVRGASSIYGDQKPLWVVDGIVLEDVVDVSADDLASGDAATLISSSVAGVNSDDIENIQILKDASATALYGARAMNGVVVITTKRGSKGSMRVSYSGEFTMRVKPMYQEYNIMNSQQQMMFYRDLEEKGWLNYADVSRAAKGGVYRKMYDALDNYDPQVGFELQNTPEDRMRYLSKYEKVNTDWFGILFKNSIQQSHSVSFSVGSERSSFFASLSFFNDPGWTIGDNVSRYTANMNSSFDINKYLKFNFLTSHSYRKQRAPGTIGRETDPVNGSISRNFDLNPFSFALNTSRTMRPYDENGDPEYYVMNYAPFNIIQELKLNYLDIDMLDSKFQAEFEIRPLDGWDIKLLGAVRFVKSTREHKIKEGSNLAECYRADYDATVRGSNNFLYNDPSTPGLPAISVLPQGGFYNRTDNRLLNYYFRATTNYSGMIAERHMYNVMAGMEMRSTNRRETYSKGFGIQYDRGNVPFIDYRIIKQILERNDQYFGLENAYDRFVAMFLTGSFSWAGKYTLNLTGRYDGSNRMGQATSSRWLPTWNVSGAWNVKEESFMQNIDNISLLTLRATYGLTASMGPATNAKAVFMGDVSFRPTQAEKENQIVIHSLENSELTWEKQYELNLGADLGLWNNRVSVSTDVYFRNGFDLIGILRTMGIGGESLKYANYADMKSNGVELTINTKNMIRPKFSWTTNLTFAYNRNEITNLASNSQVMQLISPSGAPMEGKPVRGVYAIPFKGLNSQGLPTYLNQDHEVTVSDLNLQEVQKTDFLKYMGSADPKFTGGFDNSFKYGDFRLAVFFTYQFGSKIWLDPVFKYRYYDNEAIPNEFADRWMAAGDEKYTKIPAIISHRQYKNSPELELAYNAYNYSTERVAKGDFIRLKEVTLSYDIPKDWIKGWKIENLSFRVSASNLCILYADKKLKGQDPEFARSGGVALPVPRQFTLAVKLGF
ncbi:MULTISPECIES: SusC/RagA family TonB-linked outer membrane protein [Butyricimonas]|uniref:SusC/RagA family TonB-linked outer membrane protein n=1 Tax=Butyricimonas TaxID=574697 RepID=UPI001D06F469|nr:MULTISPECIES: SusC/RagA family TonB-linked outer membrane protein [Butyricimonas]MCB6972443.1 SusC/RagA family TonB-linked outer membrane protein [Butyricimonas synergistica]MCG4519451.1 SusC/RagA family TonB-linked outer membrane protein [Butyricimonas sp. DFI.6.44]